MTDFSISEDLLQAENAARKMALDEDYAALTRALSRRGIDGDALTRSIMAFGVAIPTWGVGTGGTRFARFPGPGEDRKSTRLNSSHGYISYAVFCLKKKKKKTID